MWRTAICFLFLFSYQYFHKRFCFFFFLILNYFTLRLAGRGGAAGWLPDRLHICNGSGVLRGSAAAHVLTTPNRQTYLTCVYNVRVKRTSRPNCEKVYKSVSRS